MQFPSSDLGFGFLWREFPRIEPEVFKLWPKEEQGLNRRLGDSAESRPVQFPLTGPFQPQYLQDFKPLTLLQEPTQNHWADESGMTQPLPRPDKQKIVGSVSSPFPVLRRNKPNVPDVLKNIFLFHMTSHLRWPMTEMKKLSRHLFYNVSYTFSRPDKEKTKYINKVLLYCLNCIVW